MSAFIDLFKVIIGKSGLRKMFFSIAIAIIVQKLCHIDYWWTIVVFCGCYLFSCFIVWLYKLSCYRLRKNKAKEEEEECSFKRLHVIYKSLPQNTQQQLIELYKLPEQDFVNIRVLDCSHKDILDECEKVKSKYHLLGIEKGIGSYIITIDKVFCKVLAMHKSDFDLL